MNEQIYDFSKNDNEFLTNFYSVNMAEKMIGTYILHNHNIAKAALILIDVDNFKKINESTDFQLSDKILNEMSEKLKVLFRRTDVISKIGADRFLVFMKDIADETIVFEKEKQISYSLNDTYCVNKKNINVTVSIGAAYMDGDIKTYGKLKEHALESLSFAQSLGRGQSAIYNPSKYSQPIMLIKKPNDDYEKMNIIPLCLNFLTQIKDFKVAITKVLELIGGLYHLKRIYFLEFSRDERFVSMNYEWYSTEEESQKGNFQKLDYQNYIKILASFDKQDMLILTKQTPVLEQLQGYIPEVSGTVLLIPSYMHEKINGIFGIEYREANYTFTKSEIILFQYIVNLISIKIENFHYEEEIKHLSGFDTVTGLMNFISFYNHSEEFLNENTDGNYAICSFELNSLNEVSEWYGYTTGNKIVKYFADLLKNGIPNILFATRNGHSIFHILVNVNNREDFIASLHKLYENKKLYLENEILPINFSGGVYFFDGNEKTNISYVIDRSDIARKSIASKEHIFVIYDDVMEKKLLKEKKIASRMTNALKEKEFKIYLQPKYRISNEAFTGSEALVRWISPKFGFLPPNEFIPLFEKNEFIVELDFYILDNVCQYIQNRYENQMDIYRISVNQSRVTISRTDYIKRLRELLKQYTFPRKYIELEITESVFSDNMDEIIKVIEQIKALDCTVSIDDFGSGYSSLNMIRKIPFDVLKLDREFLPQKTFSNKSFQVLESIVEMAKKINVEVICEGVETRNQIDYLEQIGCDLVQGYYFSKPMPIEDFDNYIYRNKRSEETLKRIFEVALDHASKKLAILYNKKFYTENPRRCPNRIRQLLKLADLTEKDMIGVKSSFLDTEIQGSIFIMMKKQFVISMLNNELDKDDDEIMNSLFQLNENAIIKLKEMGEAVTTSYANDLEGLSGIKIDSFSLEVFKESPEDMLQHVVTEMNRSTEKVHCIENRLYIHRNYREEMVAQIFLFMDKEVENIIIDSAAQKGILDI